ncbi:hypothetical protein A2797_00600 [candidate division WWE3 bacterium RIFCSPHIGHO2_01_FULL_48_15]|uniref:Uncharacterized protein n=1 Tax=candidate division WWE3 bacterium RIFCSPHIGHO2_01_FULL_48_15 TaxID=1802619 RepID=A0A1F4VBL1_UNCKA|nr:MAG: hypothetical protein A2797_00600 [candidate division WWE3 bacterium RIFCSPHIGHO2_01_FULL_48_15]
MTRARALRNLVVTFSAALAWILSGYAIMLLFNPAVGFLYFLGSFTICVRLLGVLAEWLDHN